MEITINYSDMKFYDENYEKLIHTVLTKGAELQKVPEEAEISVLSRGRGSRSQRGGVGFTHVE